MGVCIRVEVRENIDCLKHAWWGSQKLSNTFKLKKPIPTMEEKQ